MRFDRVTIFGLGKVGSSIAFALINQSMNIKQLDLIEIDVDKLTSEHSDLLQAKETLKKNIDISMPIHPRESDIYIITAGTRRGKRKISRTNLHEENYDIVREIVKQIKKAKHEESIVLMVTNPSNKLSQMALDYIPYVIPCGSLIDNARLRLCKVNGPHEKPKIESKCEEVIRIKGYTQWAITSEVVRRINHIRWGYG